MNHRPKTLAILRITFSVLVLFSASLSQVNENPIFGNAFKGKVSLSSKKPTPLRSVWVIVFQDGKEITRALTGDDGRFYAKIPGTGTYDVSVKRGKSELCTVRLKLPYSSGALFNPYSEMDLKVKTLKVRKGPSPRCDIGTPQVTK